MNKKRKVCLFSKLLLNMPEGLAAAKRTVQKTIMVLGWQMADIVAK